MENGKQFYHSINDNIAELNDLQDGFVEPINTPEIFSEELLITDENEALDDSLFEDVDPRDDSDDDNVEVVRNNDTTEINEEASIQVLPKGRTGMLSVKRPLIPQQLTLEEARKKSKAESEVMTLLYEQYQKPLLGFAYRKLGDRDISEDIVQETFITVYLIYEITGQEIPLKALFFKIANNKIVSEIRRQNRQTISFLRVESMGANVEETSRLDIIPDQHADVSAIAEQNDQKLKIERAISMLSPTYRREVALRYYGQLKFNQIGKILGINEATARTHFARGIAVLRRSSEIRNIFYS